MNRDSLTGQAIAQSHYVFIARVDRATGTAAGRSRTSEGARAA
jgi:hypothetical protein